MDPIKQFEVEKKQRIAQQGTNEPLKSAANRFQEESIAALYSYNFSWMGRPVIQYPQDLMAMQEILWEIKPDLVIETGIAHGGSLIFYASILELIGKGEVLGIDIDIRPHQRKAIEPHPMYKRIRMIEGSSIDPTTLEKVSRQCADKKRILVALDSNHTFDHVYQEMELYSSFVTRGSYLIVFDTIIERLPDDLYPDRPWGKGDNPETAVSNFLKKNERFVIDTVITDKLLITVAPGGYLKCIKD
ncbi:MAG: cephalosporin hydroxylase family protein [Deltaproteobacteria bacterium]|nr:cephalosporin hydroxylase family protein [Deltaproteobacteria bacterium]